ncbi:hypothetical protein PARHAE_02036 [Paracoccus haematequi]|uniref:VPLPA-CTERM protein sorting domain-containing protein n=1 Tax=Paracoccus haematequi TaxID=2491866 RepID=A0A447IMX7_9RHOB|nr:VPLPA-CTERM sorting domain-containing protein [Paracoccus haematequi]VDS08851.1 hypothetical protein PARHAE_02036 [Paracoccus haematequi]
MIRWSRDGDDSRFLEVALGIRALCAAAAVVVGVGSAAEAATSRCAYSDMYDLKGERIAYDFDLYFKEGQVGEPGNYIEAFGIYTRDVPIPMRMNAIFLPSDYCADITLSSQGEEWSVASSGWVSEFFATGINPDGAKYSLALDPWSPSESFVDLEYWDGIQTTWVLLSVDNIRPAPIPLPSAAVLLPVGVGALTVLRKRRRSA